MNFFAHAFAFLDGPGLDPYFVAGTALPDWLSVADRQLRLRSRHLGPWLSGADGPCAALARGVLQHWADDAHFHGTRAFVECTLSVTVLFRDGLGGEQGLRTALVSHVLVELLLDAALIAEDPGRLRTYYRLLEGVGGEWLQAAVNRMAPRPTSRLAPMFSGFCRGQVLWDYLEDGKLLVRLGQVMRRLGLPELPGDFGRILPAARRLIESRKTDLLAGIPALGPAAESGDSACPGAQSPGLGASTEPRTLNPEPRTLGRLSCDSA